MNHFVIGDIHGCYKEFSKLLRFFWQPKTERLVLLGDLCDRGPESLKVIQLAMMLKNKMDAIVLMGNHEDLFLAWLENPIEEKDLYYASGGEETINSFLGKHATRSFTPDYLAMRIQNEYEEEIAFLKNLPLYYEMDEYVCVHAGVDLMKKEWKNSNENDFKWVRARFHHERNETGKIFIFGHQPTRYLNKDESDNVWISPCETKIGIDGACVFGGKLHGMRVSEFGTKIYSI